MKTRLFLLLCAVLFIVSCCGCTTGHDVPSESPVSTLNPLHLPITVPTNVSSVVSKFKELIWDGETPVWDTVSCDLNGDGVSETVQIKSENDHGTGLYAEFMCEGTAFTQPLTPQDDSDIPDNLGYTSATAVDLDGDGGMELIVCLDVGGTGWFGACVYSILTYKNGVPALFFLPGVRSGKCFDENGTVLLNGQPAEIDGICSMCVVSERLLETVQCVSVDESSETPDVMISELQLTEKGFEVSFQLIIKWEAYNNANVILERVRLWRLPGIGAPSTPPPVPTTVPLYRDVSLTRDGTKQSLVLLDTRNSGDACYLQVLSEDGQVLHQEELGYSHVGWNALFLVRLDDGDCLLRYNPYGCCGTCEYTFHVFYLNEAGAVNVPGGSGALSMDMNAVSSRHYDKQEAAAFLDALNPYLESAELLVSSDGFINNNLEWYFADEHPLNLHPEFGTPMFYGTRESPCRYYEYFHLTDTSDMKLTQEERLDKFEADIFGALSE